MNYTEMYRKIYAAAKKDSVPHELAHSISVRITDAITTLRTYVRDNYPELTETVEEVISDSWSKPKIGGYDLDDYGRPLDGHD